MDFGVSRVKRRRRGVLRVQGKINVYRTACRVDVLLRGRLIDDIPTVAAASYPWGVKLSIQAVGMLGNRGFGRDELMVNFAASRAKGVGPGTARKRLG